MAKDDTATRRARAVEILPGAPPLPGMGGAVRRLTANGFLLWQLSLREFTGASKGSFLGGLWSWLYPLMLLVVYSLVFSTVFKMRWGLDVPEGFASFALVLFCGFIPYNFLATVVQRSATVIVNNSGLVAKVVMPLELLPANRLPARINALRGTRLAVLAPAAALLDWPASVVLRLVAPADAATYARRLYALLHQLDESGAERILVAAPPQGELWEAVGDRLRRAAAAAEPGEDGT